jgi:type I restriction enzyme S subunit
MITAQWKETTLRDEVELLYGKSLPEAAREEGAIPVYGSNGVVGFHDVAAVDGPGIIVGRKGSVGEVKFCRSAFWPIDTTYYVHNLSGHNWYFLYYLLSSLGLTKLNSHSAVPGLNRDSAYEITCHFPPNLEQEKIAAVLWTIQRAIEIEDKLIASTRELKQSAMHQLFTHGLRREQLKETDIGPVPGSWHVARLGDFFDIKHGFAFKGQFFSPAGKYILMTPGHFWEEGGFRDQKEKTKFYLGEFPKEYLLSKGDLLVAMTEQTSGLLGSPVLVPESSKYLHNQRLGLVVNLDEMRLDKGYVYHLFNTLPIRAKIAQCATGSKVKHTSPGRILDLQFGLPSISEQQQIAAMISAIDQRIAIHTQKRRILNELFQTLLHQLMAGEIRVADLAIDVSEVTK